jgi:two-component system, cell cycle response regulator
MSSSLAQKETKRNERGAGARIAANTRRPLRILFVHRDAADVERCVEELRSAQFVVSADVVLTLEQFAEQLRSHRYDLVVAEYPSPNWQGPQALELLHQTERQIPLIFVTDTMRRKALLEITENGAADYIEMDRIAYLPGAVRRALDGKLLREERDRAEKQLRHSEAHYRALVENPSFGICQFDVGGRFLAVNQALVAMLGYESKSELMAVNLATDIIRDPTERAQLFEPYRQTGRVDRMEVEWRRKDGTPMKVRLSGREVHGERGGANGCEIIAEDVTEQRASEDHLRHLAETDALTGLANYRRLAEALEAESKRSDRTGRAFAVLVLDLNGMKKINDTYGHLAGNEALCRLADILRYSCRIMDTAARCGGDEFAIVLPETRAAEAGMVARRICRRLADDRKGPPLSVSVGVAAYPEDGETIESLLRVADRGLYRMKSGKEELPLAQL